MSGGALGLALGAAVLHAGWNVLLAGARDVAAATGGLLVYGALLLAPAAIAVGDVSGSAVPFIAASAALELAYFVLLARAYAGGELSVVYPVARGVAPALVLVVAATAGLGEGVGALGAAGVLTIVAGVLLVSAPLSWISVAEQPIVRTAQRDLGFGLAIAAVIAAYTLVDAEGVERAEPLAYLALVVAPCALLYPAVVRTRPDLGARSALTAAATFGAFLMVLAAFRLAPAAPVAAVRESSVVIAGLLAAAFLRERLSASKLAGTIAVLAGVTAIAYS